MNNVHINLLVFHSKIVNNFDIFLVRKNKKFDIFFFAFYLSFLQMKQHFYFFNFFEPDFNYYLVPYHALYILYSTYS